MIRYFIVIALFFEMANAVISPTLLQKMKESAHYKFRIEVLEVKEDERCGVFVKAKVIGLLNETSPKIKLKTSSIASPLKRQIVKKGDIIEIRYLKKCFEDAKGESMPLLAHKKTYKAYLKYNDNYYEPSAYSMSFVKIETQCRK